MKLVSACAVLLLVIFVQSPAGCFAASANLVPVPQPVKSWLGRKACSIPDPSQGTATGEGLNAFVARGRQAVAKKSGTLYAKAIRLNGKLAAAYYNRGNDELKQKQYKKAIRDYDKSLKLYPGDEWAMRNRSLAGHEMTRTK